mgnify:CR=1 FL=1
MNEWMNCRITDNICYNWDEFSCFNFIFWFSLHTFILFYSGRIFNDRIVKITKTKQKKNAKTKFAYRFCVSVCVCFHRIFHYDYTINQHYNIWISIYDDRDIIIIFNLNHTLIWFILVFFLHKQKLKKIIESIQTFFFFDSTRTKIDTNLFCFFFFWFTYFASMAGNKSNNNNQKEQNYFIHWK